MTLDGLYTRTRVAFLPDLAQDELTLDGQGEKGSALARVSHVLDRVRKLAGISLFAQVTSQNNFPIGAGLASSASAFAALTLAAVHATELELNQQELSRLARTGSGSACRSIPGGFVEWLAGDSDENSFAYSFAPANHWDIVDCIAVVSQEQKTISSEEGHALAETSPLQSARVGDSHRRLEICRQAILRRDFEAFAEIIELDSNWMHAVIMTSKPPILYWLPATISVIQAVHQWRNEGLPVCYTIDAGPNLHVITTSEFARQVSQQLLVLPGVEDVLTAHPGDPARIVQDIDS